MGTPGDIATRVEVVKRRDAYERDPQGFAQRFAAETEALQRKLTLAMKRLSKITTSEAALTRAAELCLKLGTDGLRGELTLIRTARALAAFEVRARSRPAM